jgi:hypothetical protein
MGEVEAAAPTAGSHGGGQVAILSPTKVARVVEIKVVANFMQVHNWIMEVRFLIP